MYPLKTARLRIEPLRPDHAPKVVEALGDTRLYTYLPDDPPSLESLQRRYDFLANGRSPDGEEQWLNWIVFLVDSETPVGTFQATLPKGKEGAFAYMVFPPFWRQGYAREMAICVIDHLFATQNLPGLFAEIDTRNLASIRLAESLGLTHVATTRDADVFKGSTSDEYTYSVSSAAWQRIHHE